jgi:hypothetical protein
VVDATGGKAVSAARVEGLDRQEHLAVRAADDHADLGEAVGVLHRVEERPDRDLDPARLAEAGRQRYELLGLRRVQLHLVETLAFDEQAHFFMLHRGESRSLS